MPRNLTIFLVEKKLYPFDLSDLDAHHTPPVVVRIRKYAAVGAQHLALDAADRVRCGVNHPHYLQADPVLRAYPEDCLAAAALLQQELPDLPLQTLARVEPGLGGYLRHFELDHVFELMARIATKCADLDGVSMKLVYQL